MFELHAGKKRNLSVAGAVPGTQLWEVADPNLAVLQVQPDGSADILAASDQRGEVAITCTGKHDSGLDFIAKETATILDKVVVPPTEIAMTVGEEIDA